LGGPELSSNCGQPGITEVKKNKGLGKLVGGGGIQNP